MPKSESVKQRRTDNTMAKRNKEGQTIQWPKETKKDRQYNGQKKQGHKENQKSTKHYTENLRLNNTKLSKHISEC